MVLKENREFYRPNKNFKGAFLTGLLRWRSSPVLFFLLWNKKYKGDEFD